MYRVRCVARSAKRVNLSALSGALLAVLGLICPEPAHAIPSPELIVGSFVSFSQLFALASAMLGGGAVYASMRAGRRGATGAGLLVGAAITTLLLFASVGVNIYQYVVHSNERQERLEETLLRPARTPGALPGDPEVKELSFAQQLKHPDAMSTAEADRLLQSANRGERDDLLFLDVRERAEREMGTLQGVTFVRYPDIATSGLNFKGKLAILFCHNGNRSHETCEALKKQGVDCRFIVGGVEKWVTEGRKMEGLEARSLDELRAIPSYPNRNTLLDTPDVRRLVTTEKAIFVDVRYPVEFKQHGHLPNAINLTIRRIPTAELPNHFAALPKHPIILPCYDRRGCFFAEVLGYELSRAGHDVRGRYTQPWAYFSKSPRPPHVEQWIAEQNKSIWAKSAAWLSGIMAVLAQWIGVVASIVVLAVLSRLAVLPFSLKAERDQIRGRAVGSELDTLKNRLKEDPVRRVRAIRSFYKRHGLTPAFNLLALLFLPVMAIALLAVQDLTVAIETSFLWVPSLAERDPLLVLPVLFGFLITLYVDLAFVTTRTRRIIVWLSVLPVMTVTGALLGAGVDIYLVVSAALLLLQRMVVAGHFTQFWRQFRHSGLPDGVVALDDPPGLANHGNKAYRLGQMRAAGLPVPDGLLLTSPLLGRFSNSTSQARQQILNDVWRRLACERVAVRSSGVNEDGGSQSFAGVFESVLNIKRSDLEAAILRVQASFHAERVASYAPNGFAGSVLVQRMVDAEWAGVLFTRDPSAGGLAMVEMVQGTAQDLVSGVVSPQTYRFGRITKKTFGKPPPIDLAPLLALGDRAETLFGRPQDIEWTYCGGAFYVVQSRDITRDVVAENTTAAVQRDLARVVDCAKGARPDEIVFAKTELSEMLPRPTPLSLSLMEALWASGGSIDLAARELGLSYEPEEDSTYLTTILGRLYVDKRHERARALKIGRFAARKLLRNADQIEREFRVEFLPQFLDKARLLGIADFDSLSTSELLSEIARLVDRFVHETHVAVDVINIAASFYLERSRRALAAAGVDPSVLLGNIPETFENRAIAEATETKTKSRRWLLLKNFGHRALLDYELSEPRFAEDLNALNRMILGREQASRARYHETPALRRSIARGVDIARRFQTLKEDAKHHSLRDLQVLRRALLVLDQRFGFEGRIFYLKADELLTVDGESVASLRELAISRQKESLLLRKATALPSTLTAQDLEAASAGDPSEMHPTPDVIRGTRVSGGKIVEGRARVVTEDDAEHGNAIEPFRDGDIIVSAMVNPAWLPYFSRAGGFVSEVGGWLSHPAILAREYDVAMVVGVAGLSDIGDGDRLRLHLDGKVEVLVKAKAGQVVAA